MSREAHVRFCERAVAKFRRATRLFVVPTIAFQRLFAFLVLGHERRRLLWFAVTCNLTAEWLARQITEAFPWDGTPKYLIRDNDRAFGAVFKAHVRAMGIRDRPTSFRSPWQNGYVERLIGSIRRECTDHCVPRTCRRRRHEALQKMRAGPSHPAIRSRMQTAASCCR